ncbi:Ribonucleoside-diphosphate reductase large subunit, partial [Armadillidium vulgare]
VTSTPSSNHSPSYSTFSSSSQLFENIDRSCKGFVRIPGKSRQLNIRGAPLQLAGVSKSLENTFASGLFQPPFKGCIKNLRINKELKDLGHSLLSQRSTPYCKQDSCSNVSFHCRLNGSF